MVKSLPANAGETRECRFDPWVRKIPWSRKRQPTPVFLPGKFHGQRGLVGYSPWGHKESDKTEPIRKAQRRTKTTEMFMFLGGEWEISDGQH